MMRTVTSLVTLIGLAAAMPAFAQSGPKVGQVEVKAYQAIPKTKTAVQLTSDTALARNLRRQVMIRLTRRGNEVGFSGGNVMRMDVSYFDFSSPSGDGSSLGTQRYDGPGANPRMDLPRNKFEQLGGLSAPVSAPTLRIVLTLYSLDGGKVLWTASSSCATHAGTAETAGLVMVDTIFDQADKSHVGDAGCPL